MDNNKLINLIRLSLRITTTAYDNEINTLIGAAVVDMKNAGIKNPNMENDLIIQTIKLYCIAYFGDKKDSEKFIKAYESLRNSIALVGDYFD